jgi:pimeloyl-ACP methyl ester carboxylesterase
MESKCNDQVLAVQRRLLLSILTIVLLGFSSITFAQLPCSDPVALPSGDPDYPLHYVITCVPQQPQQPPWNGKLVVYAHGYVQPNSDITLPEVDPALIEPLLAQGFAVATTSFHKNGYAVEQGGDDIDALVSYFKNQVIQLPTWKENVLLIGISEGALIATMLLERDPQTYHGALALCGPLGGMPYQLQYFGDFRVLFDYFFPGILPGGVSTVPEEAYDDWETVYAPAIAGALAAPTDESRQLFSTTRAPLDPNDPLAMAKTAIGVLSYNIRGMNDMIATSGGNPFGNRLKWYWGSDNDWALNVGVERVRADRDARSYTRQYYTPSGKLRRPLIAVHTTDDEIVPFRHEILYFLKALANRSLRNFTLIPIQRYGHCNITPQELTGSVGLLIQKTAQP